MKLDFVLSSTMPRPLTGPHFLEVLTTPLTILHNAGPLSHLVLQLPEIALYSPTGCR